MNRLSTVLLRHEAPTGSHYDWLLEMPGVAGGPPAKLWTARVEWPSWCWLAAEAWNLEVIGPHRRRYLTYEGPISGGGTVRRVDAGAFLALCWGEDQITIDLAMQHCRGRVALSALSGPRWRACLEH